MNFKQEIKDMLGIEDFLSDIFVYFVAGKGVVVQGYKKLLEVLDTRLVVIGKNKRKIQICGNNLEIYSLAPSEIVVHGKILLVEVLDE